MQSSLSIAPPALQKRCAIYTRKSAQPPAGQEVTSLEAQRTICSSYIVSQAHQGWIELVKRYEDSGRSGANLDRTALQELITDIELGLVEIVLVYKLDRITRTLLDFVRLIDFFDKYGIIFVAITQNFDTSDSMGRLIRNILLTFAQFEREISSDRIRDKKLIMKQRGFWTGGEAPLGYDLRRRKLVVNHSEEPAVRCIFETFVQTKSITQVHHALDDAGFRRKTWRSRAGKRKGGGPISLTALHHILRNPVYIAEFDCKGERYPALHPPIIARSLWDQTQAILDGRRLAWPRVPQYLLTGLIFDAYGRRMNGRITVNDRAYRRYYASAVVKWGTQEKIRVSRVSAGQVERVVLASISALLSDRRRLRHLAMGTGLIGGQLDRVCELGAAAAVRLGHLPPRQLPTVVKSLIYRVEIWSESVRVLLRVGAIVGFATWDGVGRFTLDVSDFIRFNQLQLIDIPADLDRVRDRHCIPIEPRKETVAHPSTSLITLVEDARAAQKLLFENRDIPLPQLAWSVGRKPVSFARLVRLNYLAPDIVAAIIDGTQPETLSRRDLMRCDLPMDWRLQRRLLGFPPRPESRAEAAADLAQMTC